MKTRWSTLTCIALMAGTAGFLGGFLTTRTPDPSYGNPERASTLAAPRVPMLIQVPDGDTPRPAESEHADELMYFPETVLAEAEALAPQETPSPAPPGPEPGILPEPSSAATPLSPLPTRRSGLEHLIDQEFSGLSDQQRAIWLEALDGLPLEDAAGILRIWKQLGRGVDADPLPDLINGGPRDPDPPSITSRPDDPRHGLPSHDTRAALQCVRELLIHNLLHAEDHGYRRYEPLLSEVPQRWEPAAPAVHEATSGEALMPYPADFRFGGWRIDQHPGTIRMTGNSMDVAISGTGFFVVMVDQETCYTRCGRFRLDEERRIVLDQARQTAVLQPELALPSDADEFAIKPDGAVQAARGDQQPLEIGRLELATFRDPGRLRPVGNTLFQATEESGPPRLRKPHSAGTGSLQQGALESSNVDFDAELSRLEWLDRLARTSD